MDPTAIPRGQGAQSRHPETMGRVWRSRTSEQQVAGPSLSSGELVRLLDITRRGIESFDKYIADLRKFHLTLVVAIIAAAVGFLRDQPLSIDQVVRSSVVQALSLLVLLFTIVFWGLDTHYHGYLKVAARTAHLLELRLHLVAEHIGITSELGAFREQRALMGNIFHLQYAIPGAGSAALLMAGIVPSSSPYYWGLVAASVILLIGALIVYVFLAPRFVGKFLGTHTHIEGDRGKEGSGR